jgi:predicted transcriptional regulator YdeE
MNDIQRRDEQIYGGLVVPRVVPSFKVSASDLVDFLKDRLRERDGDGPVHVIYVPDPKKNYNVLVCYPYSTVADVPLGSLLIRVPSGVYAKFVPIGEYKDPIEDVWAQVDAATASADILRAYDEEIEIWRTPDEVELYISVEL